MPFFHGIILIVTGWVRVLTSRDLPNGVVVKEEFNGGSYVPAFLQHFFPGRYSVGVRRIQKIKHKESGANSAPPIPTGKDLVDDEVIRFSTSSDQYSIRVTGNSGWLTAFEEIGLYIRNSKKMSKRLVELIRLSAMWLYVDAKHALKVEVIKHKYPECFVDGISAISRGVAIRCILSNKHATRRWRAQQIWKIKTGETVCVIFRMLTADGLIKGNALVLPKRMMNGYDIRTFAPNIKSEIRTSGWQWVSIDPTYGAIPVKSDDLTHAIYRRVSGLYDDATLLGSMSNMLDTFFSDLKDGRRTDWLSKLADASDSILHDEDATKRYASNRGLVGRIQVAVAQLAAAGVPLNASQTLMFLSVNGLRKQLLGDNRIGMVWTDKSKHWFPVPWAYAAHVYTYEVLELFGFKIQPGNHGFYHKATHSFVVPGEFFRKNLANHGGPDLDDTVKVHVRNVRMADGSVHKMAFILRNPNDFGEWSLIPIRANGPVFHAYGDIPTVSMDELESMVPQYSSLSKHLNVGTLPCIVNKANIPEMFNLTDEQRVRNASMAFPAGVGGTVIPKMIWYATCTDILRDHVAPNEDIIDALQQGQAGPEDIRRIQQWIDTTFLELGRRLANNMDAFWFHTRLPKSIKDVGVWQASAEDDSEWVTLHRKREDLVRLALSEMITWLNQQVVMPDVLNQISWTEDELLRAPGLHLNIKRQRVGNTNWVQEFATKLQGHDEAKGEEATDRMILLLAYWSIKAKEMESRQNHDQWLYSFTALDEPHPYEWYVRALNRVNSGHYDW